MTNLKEGNDSLYVYVRYVYVFTCLEPNKKCIEIINKKRFTAWCIDALVVLQETMGGQAAKELTQEELDKLPKYTLADVKAHDSKEDCWVVIHGTLRLVPACSVSFAGKVLNVTTFAPDHPGDCCFFHGVCIILFSGGAQHFYNNAGTDVTRKFDLIEHPDDTVGSCK